MRAIRIHEFGGPEAMRLDEVATPKPGEGQALVRIEAAGVNFIDVYQRTGLYKNPLPYGLGLEGAGVVEAVGGGVTSVRAKFRPSRALLASVKAEVGEPKQAPRRRTRADRLARQLALAYWIERQIEAGEVASYGNIAMRLGLSQPRVTQIMGLLLLPSAMQERVLLGEGRVGIREAMQTARDASWRA